MKLCLEFQLRLAKSVKFRIRTLRDREHLPGVSMDKELEALIAAAKSKPMSPSERAEQRINFAFGNLPEEYVSSSKASMKSADKVMRSYEGWDGSLDAIGSQSTESRPRSVPLR